MFRSLAVHKVSGLTSQNSCFPHWTPFHIELLAEPRSEIAEQQAANHPKHHVVPLSPTQHSKRARAGVNKTERERDTHRGREQCAETEGN